jgi:hypothetical protein
MPQAIFRAAYNPSARATQHAKKNRFPYCCVRVYYQASALALWLLPSNGRSTDHEENTAPIAVYRFERVYLVVA